MIAKEQTDDGWVCFPNVTAMASEVGCDRGSIEDWLWRECGYDVTVSRGQREWNGRPTGEQRVSKVVKSKFVLRFYLTEYNESQQVTSFRELKKRSLSRGKGRKGKEREVEYIGGLKVLKIDKSIFEEFKKEILGIDHDDELKNADLWRLDNPSKSQNPNDHLFLKNWFKRAAKGKNGNGKDLSKYDGI